MIHEMMLYALAMRLGALHFNRLAAGKTREWLFMRDTIRAIECQ